MAASKSGGAAAYRTAVSRAYYGAFHLATSHLEALGFSAPRTANVHVFVQHHLNGEPAASHWPLLPEELGPPEFAGARAERSALAPGSELADAAAPEPGESAPPPAPASSDHDRAVPATVPAFAFQRIAPLAGLVWLLASAVLLRLWDAASGRQVRPFRHSIPGADLMPPVVAVAASPDTRWIASAGDHRVRLWDRATGREHLELQGHGEFGQIAANALAFTADSRRLLSFGNDLFLRVWDVQTGRALEEHEIRPSVLDYERHPEGTIKRSRASGPFDLPDRSKLPEALQEARFVAGGRLVLRLRLGDLCIFDTASGRQLGTVGTESLLHGFAVSPDGTLLATLEHRQPAEAEHAEPGAADPVAVLRLRDFRSPENKVLRDIPQPHPGWLWRATFSPDGQLLATVLSERPGPGHWISVWETATGDERAHIGELDQPLHLAFSPDGRRLASSQLDTTALIWDLDAFRLE